MRRLPGVLLGVAVLASPLLFALPVRDWISQGEAVRASLAAAGWAAPLIFFAGSVLFTAVGLPRLVACTLGGWIFGFAWGFALAHLASLLGAYSHFLLARRSPPARLLKKYPRLKAMSVPMGRGWGSVLLVRQLPIAGLYNDILLGWSPVSHRDFWIGSFLGYLPLGVTAALAGAGAIHADLNQLGKYLALAAIAFLALNFSVKWALARKTSMDAGPA